MQYSKQQINYILNNYSNKSHKEIANDLGRSEKAIKNFLYRRGLLNKEFKWSSADVELLKLYYESAEVKSEIKLDELAKKLNRLKSNICRKARSLGLTNHKLDVLRPENKKNRNKYDNQMDRSLAASANSKKWHAENEHPKGALGMKHSPATKKKISIKLKHYNDSLTGDQKVDRVKKMLKTKIKNGTYAMPRHKTTWKSGWREIGDIKKFYRSKWEANYAYYLQSLLESGEITEWKHEPDTFWFDGIKRGCVSYLPDFRVTRPDGSIYYVEVKGWMDARSVTKLKRMKKYHPKVELLLVDSKAYKAMDRKIGHTISGWEI